MPPPPRPFVGRVDAQGKLTLDDLGRFYRRLRNLSGERVELIVRKARSKRTLDQNAYLHSVVFPLVAAATGYTMPETKLVMMGECFGWMFSKLAGREIPVKASTAGMTVKENSYFIEWAPPWALEHLGVQIPLPNEIDLDAYDEEVA